MMEAQGADIAALGRFFGADSRTVLSFTSFVNPAAKTFTYTLNPGIIYLGRALSLTSMGQSNAMSQWTWTSNLSLGTTSWSDIGTGAFTGDPWDLGEIFTLDPSGDYESHVEYTQTAARTVSLGTFVQTEHDILGNKTVLSTTTGRDTFQLQG